MRTDFLDGFIRRLDGMIAAFDQSVAMGGLSDKEREAADLLKDARLKLVEERAAPWRKIVSSYVARYDK